MLGFWSRAVTFKQAIEQNKLSLKGLRGRTAYPGVAQAAEYFLRQHSENYRLDAYRLLNVRSLENENLENHWQVTFQNGVAQHTVELTQTMSEPELSGCNGKLKPAPRYQLISIS